jgi:hypothetical protein
MLCCYARRLVVVCMVVVRSRCCHRRIPRSVVAAIVAPSVIVSSATDPLARPRRGRLRRSALRVSRGQQRRRLPLAEHLELRPCRNVFFVLVVPACLRLRCRPPPPETPCPSARTPPLSRWCCRHELAERQSASYYNTDVDHRHRHRRDRRTPHCRRSGARRRCDD